MADPQPAESALPTRRRQIDAVDRDLLSLLNRRAGHALAVGEIKKREGSVVFRPEREAQVIEGLKTANPGPLQTDSVAPIWREIMSACRALETPTRVAYLGPAGTFSEQAALAFFGSSIVRVPCASIDEVFRSVFARHNRQVGASRRFDACNQCRERSREGARVGSETNGIGSHGVGHRSTNRNTVISVTVRVQGLQEGQHVDGNRLDICGRIRRNNGLCDRQRCHSRRCGHAAENQITERERHRVAGVVTILTGCIRGAGEI